MLKNLTIFFILIFMISCTKNSEINDPDNLDESINKSTQINSNLKDFNVFSFIYKKKKYEINYHLNTDSTFVFKNSSSAKHYELYLSLNENPVLTTVFKTNDVSIYLYDSYKSYLEEEYINKKKKFASKQKIEKLTKCYSANDLAKVETKDSIESSHLYNTMNYYENNFTITDVLPKIENKGKTEYNKNNQKAGGWEPNPSAFINLYRDMNFSNTMLNCINNHTEVLSNIYGCQYGIHDLNVHGFSDVASSIKIGNASTRHMVVILFEHINYSGKSYVFGLSSMDYTTFNVFSYSNFQNLEWRECFLCRKKNFNDEASSIAWGWLDPSEDNIASRPNWSYISNAYVVAASALVKTGPSGWYNAGAIANAYEWVNPRFWGSTPNTLVHVFKGEHVEVEIASLNFEFMIGFSSQYSSSPAYNTIEFAMNNSDYFNNTIRCYKYGSFQFSSGVSYEVGDIMRMEFSTDYMNIYLNSLPIGRIFHGNNSGAYYIDCSLNETNSILPSPVFSYSD